MAYKFKPRLKAPSGTNKNWIQVAYGGRNKCIPVTGKSVLPNCVGYAWGRFMEINDNKQPKLSLNNAENWYVHRTDGYSRGKKPRLGAVICWRKGVVGCGEDGAGHVAIVEAIHDDGSITISQSAYRGTRFWTEVLPLDEDGTYHFREGYHFQGFIYNPKVPKDKDIKKSVHEIALEVIQGLWGNGADRRKRLTDAGYNYDEVQAEVNRILKGEN